jgi:hypothetical protein
MVWNWFYSLDEALTQGEKDEEISGNGPAYVDPVTFRAAVNPRNNWLIDRDMQRHENFTGIQGVNAQDRAVQEAMGPIVNRSKEHLGQTDRAVIMTRRMLLKAIDTVADGGTPPGLGESYYSARAIEDVIPEEELGLDALSDRMFAGGR